MVTILMALFLLLMIWKTRETVQVYSYYTNLILGTSLLIAPIAQFGLFVSLFYNVPQIVKYSLAALNEATSYCVFFATYLRQWQLYRILHSRERSDCIRSVTIKFAVLYAMCLLLAIGVAVQCEFTDSCYLWGFTIYHYLPGAYLVTTASYYCYKVRTVSYVFRDQHGLYRLLAFEYIFLIAGLVLMTMSTVGIGIMYAPLYLFAFWVIAAETQGENVVNNIHKYYKGVPLFDEHAILADVYTIVGRSSEVELLIQDDELRAVLLDVARQNYSGECVQFLCDLHAFMPNFKYNKDSPLAPILSIVATYVQTKQATTLNIEWSLRKKVLELAKDAEAGNSSRNINQSSRPQSWSERMFLPEDGSRSLKLSNLLNKAFSNDALFARVVVERDDHSSEKSLTPKAKGPVLVLPTGVIDVGESDGTAKTSRSIENINYKRQVSCNESASGALALKPKLFASDNITLDCDNINGSRIISKAEDDEETKSRRMSQASQHGYSRTSMFKRKVSHEQTCVKLGYALEETAQSVCVLLRFSGILEKFKEHPKFIEITEMRNLLARNHMEKIMKGS